MDMCESGGHDPVITLTSNAWPIGFWNHNEYEIPGVSYDTLECFSGA